MKRLPSIFLIACGGLLLCLTGCRSSGSTSELTPAESQILGTWEYSVTGARILDRGTMQIQRDRGRLIAVLRDRHRGRFRARVSARKNWMEIRLDDLHISGRLHNGRYRATVAPSEWDASFSGSARRSFRRSRASLVATQTQTLTRHDSTVRFGCEPLLRESSYACSPLHPDEVN